MTTIVIFRADQELDNVNVCEMHVITPTVYDMRRDTKGKKQKELQNAMNIVTLSPSISSISTCEIYTSTLIILSTGVLEAANMANVNQL